MRSIEDKGCLIYGPAKEISGSSSTTSFEFQKANNCPPNRTPHHRTALGKPTPSKWDDAQKWLVNLSRGGEKKNQSKATPRNSNADDLRLIAPVPKMESYSSEEEEGFDRSGSASATQYEVETKNVDREESIWRINKPSNSTAAVRSVCVRDMGTEMTPIASQEPSRTATPLRATTPAARSPLSSGASTPVSHQNGAQALESGQTCVAPIESSGEAPGRNVVTRLFPRDGEEMNASSVPEQKSTGQSKNVGPLENRAMAWDEAERAKYMARYKREEVKIQAWENHEKRKAEMEKRRIEVKAERLKSRAQEKYNNKLAATRRIAEEKRANAEAKLNEKAVKTSERADYIRRTGHLPSSFSFKLPFFCW